MSTYKEMAAKSEMTTPITASLLITVGEFRLEVHEKDIFVMNFDGSRLRVPRAQLEDFEKIVTALKSVLRMEDSLNNLPPTRISDPWRRP